MKLRVIFFDLGGTLLKLRRDRVLQTILENQGISVPLQLIHDVYHLADAWWEEPRSGGRVLSRQEEEEALKELNFFLVEKLGLMHDRVLGEHLASVVQNQWLEVEHSIEQELYPDVQPCLQELRSRGLKLGLISNAPPETQETVSSLGLDRYIDHIVISGIVGVAKPDPAIFRYALNLASADPAESLHLGDSYKADVLGARGAGLRAILLDRDDRHFEADCPRIRNLDELESLISW